MRQRRTKDKLVSIETIEAMPGNQSEWTATGTEDLERLSKLIQHLKPLDRQIIISYLEGMDTGSIGDLTGLSRNNISIKIHRIKKILRGWFGQGGSHAR